MLFLLCVHAELVPVWSKQKRGNERAIIITGEKNYLDIFTNHDEEGNYDCYKVAK